MITSGFPIRLSTCRNAAGACDVCHGTHIDVGLEDGFLAKEYRKALKDRLSPPCGKPYGDIIHHTNLADADADERKLICYDCGVACDMTAMRDERLVMLRSLGAYKRSEPVFVAEEIALLPKADAKALSKKKWAKPKPQQRFAVDERHKIRLRYAKLGRLAYLGHLDVARVLARVFRRAHLDVAYSQGFHPKPVMEYGPALSLGIPSLGELFDISLANELPPSEVLERLQQVSPDGLEFLNAMTVAEGEKRLSRCIDGFDLLVSPAPDGIEYDEARCARVAARLLERETIEIPRKAKMIEVRQYIDDVQVVDSEAATRLCAAFDWEKRSALLRVKVLAPPTGSAKPTEVALALGVAGSDALTGPKARLARLGFWGVAEAGDSVDPLASREPMATLVAY